MVINIVFNRISSLINDLIVNTPLKGTVLKSTGSWYKVRTSTGEVVEARVRGKLRTQGIRSTNPVAVGDKVVIDETDDGDWVIADVHDRRNYIIRKATKLSSKTHIVAANIDLCLVMVTLKQPQLKLGFLDRLLVTARAYDIPSLIVVNKVDLLETNELEYLEQLRGAYAECDVASHAISVATGEGVEELRGIIDRQCCLITGHSGVGKSSLLNALNPDLGATVKALSNYNEKGTHTTTFAELHELWEGTYLIDSPGLKSFGLINMEPEELKGYFPEMHTRANDCKFHNCLHINEPGCAVKPAYERSELPWFRYENYLHFYNDLKAENQV